MSIRAPKTADEAFTTLKPMVDELTQLSLVSPLSGKERLGLTLMLASHFMGIAMAAMAQEHEQFADSSVHDLARPVAEVIVGMLESRGAEQQQ